MNEEDPDLLAGENLEELRGRKMYIPMSECWEETENAKYQNLRGMNPMSERFRLWQELENAKYQNNLLAQKCRELEHERDEARRKCCELWAGTPVPRTFMTAADYADEKGWDCFKEDAND